MSDKTIALSFEALAVANALVIKELIGALLASGALNAEAVQAGFASAHRHLNGATLPATADDAYQTLLFLWPGYVVDAGGKPH